jgi:hypothetical protein
MPKTDERVDGHLNMERDEDPILANTRFPLRTIYFPLGFPVEIASNSPEIMEAARQSWGRFQFRFPFPPLLLRMGVNGEGSEELVPPEPVCRLQWNILSNVADRENFIVSDLERGRSFGWVTRTTLESPMYLRYHFLEAAALSMISVLRAVPVHAACVALQNHGVLLCGDSGAGKSSLAFSCARSGWTYVSDDSTYIPLNRSDRLVIGNSHQIRFRPSGASIFPELEGRPITPRAAGKPSIEIPITEFPGIVAADSTEVHFIIRLNRRQVSNPELVRVPSGSLSTSFHRDLIPLAEMRSTQENAIRRLVEAETFELRYNDLDWAVDRLQQLVNTGR